MDETLTIKPHQRLATILLLLTACLLAGNFFIYSRDSASEHLLFIGYCMALTSWSLVLLNQKIIFHTQGISLINIPLENQHLQGKRVTLNYNEITACRLEHDRIEIIGKANKVICKLSLSRHLKQRLKRACVHYGVNLVNPAVHRDQI